ncbi:D-alanyl-D-alanine carboxypeptidase family protein [Clostridium sp. Marseille-P2415]|uniref:D-alanyl-D-alanine carboxypeptidase family protein n=1 Tax=Clostridium sp. Marseille-P2415 TaxID=1805471 RepID=UPI00098858E5|nr:D-alanyl-D-alanine carboxypeptidase family protein [Clostridium sp. Marseille-P2415]
MTQFTKRISIFFLCLLLFVSSFAGTALAAAEWPANVSVQAQGAILMDADTGTVLWGQNIHNQYFPASITKVMTALLVIENCSLDETVTFSHNAVFNVESGSSNAGINEGDELSVKDCLYALLLKSANESANALAEHVAGSTEAFADMMNARAKELGCTNTHFANPSGLNNPEHYTSPYDMALIARAAFNNPIFEEIDSTTYYKLPPNSINQEGLSIYPGHKMLKKSSPYYYPGIVGGKTGYTTLAGNTLVTCAEKNGMKLITIILKGSTPQYWTDTKNLLDFGFENFVSLKAADYEKTYSSITSDLNFSGLSITRPEALILDPDSRIILPKTADFSDAAAELSYDISSGDPQGAIAKINYRYNDRVVGCTFLEVNGALFPETASGSEAEAFSESADAVDASAKEIAAKGSPDRSAGKEPPSASVSEDYREKALKPFEIPLAAWLILGSVGAIAVIGGTGSFLIYKKHKDEQDFLIRREQRMKRLQDSGISADEFNSILEQKRSAYSSKRKGRRGSRLKFR